MTLARAITWIGFGMLLIGGIAMYLIRGPAMLPGYDVWIGGMALPVS